MNNTARDDEFHYLSRSPSHHVPTQQELSSSKAAFLLRIEMKPLSLYHPVVFHIKIICKKINDDKLLILHLG